MAPIAFMRTKSAAGEIQIGERKQREHLRAILGDAAIAHLAIAELAFDDAEHMFDLRAHFAEAAIARLLSLGKLAPRFRLLLDRPQHASVFGSALLLVAGVALVAVVLVYREADRRRGIASSLYDLIEQDLRQPLRPSRIRSKAGRAFWARRRLRETA